MPSITTNSDITQVQGIQSRTFEFWAALQLNSAFAMVRVLLPHYEMHPNPPVETCLVASIVIDRLPSNKTYSKESKQSESACDMHLKRPKEIHKCMSIVFPQLKKGSLIDHPSTPSMQPATAMT
jgi:hypothetical protein